MRGLRYCLPVFFLSLLLPAIAQQMQAQQPVRQIVLGNSTEPLDGLWKFHIGDSPQATGTKGMAWAQPGFDDSAWGTMNLTPPPGSYDPLIGSSGFVPGWTTRGYKDYSGYAWYRLRVNIQGNQSALALKMPDTFDDAYQVYVNGQLVGEFGRFTASGVTAYVSQARAFPLPAVPAATPSGAATIAIRMFMRPFTALTSQDAGGLHGPPVLGHAAAIANLLRLDWDIVDRLRYSRFLEMAVLPLALLVAFALFWLDRTEPAYRWLGLTCAVILGYNAVTTLPYYSTWIDGDASLFFTGAVFAPIAYGLWVIFWATWFRLGGMARLHRIVWSVVVLLGMGMAMMRPPLNGSVVPVHASVWLVPLTTGLNGLLGLLLLWVAIRGIRQNKAEGWLALPALVAVAVSEYSPALFDFLHWSGNFLLFGIGFSLGQVGTVVSLIIVTVLLLRRFLHAQREREQWRLEIEQAKQVQQMLIPEALPMVPGFTLESEYRPAQQVGGDFFQILPDRSDGSVLIVVGDVTGKGLQAAMLVSLLVGAIRTATDTNFDPLHVLRTLNQRLLGRGQAHATCLALRIETDGAATLANAGHLPPYLNGKDLPMEGAMLLGMMEGAEFSQMQFQLRENDRLILMSDGIVEAQDKDGHLFGFERIHAMLQNPITAAEVATAAQNFGQQDDITVLSVTRTVGREMAVA